VSHYVGSRRPAESSAFKGTHRLVGDVAISQYSSIMFKYMYLSMQRMTFYVCISLNFNNTYFL